MKRLINPFINIFRVLTTLVKTDMNDFHADFNSFCILFLFLYRKLDAEREGKKKKELSKHIPGPLQGQ